MATVPEGIRTEGLLGKRFLARVIDSIFAFLLSGLVTMPLAVLDGPKALKGILASCAALLVWCAYFTFLESSSMQATPGKNAMRLKVYNLQGMPMSWPKSFIRVVVRDLPFFALSLSGVRGFSILLLAAHLVVVHRSSLSQAIHDRVAGTWIGAPEVTAELYLS